MGNFEKTNITGKALCISNDKYYALTPGEIYTYTGTVYNNRTRNDCYILDNDAGVNGWFPKYCFMDLKEHRENKLKELLK